MCEFCGCGLYKSVQVILPKEESLEAWKQAFLERGGPQVVFAEVKVGEDCCVPACGPATCG